MCARGPPAQEHKQQALCTPGIDLAPTAARDQMFHQGSPEGPFKAPCTQSPASRCMAHLLNWAYLFSNACWIPETAFPPGL